MVEIRSRGFAATRSSRPSRLNGIAVPILWGEHVVCTEILNSGVVVMESAKDGARIDDTGPLNRARDRRILVL
jgi:hypothetical protein